MSGKVITTEGGTAVATVAHATNEIIAIYPITPSSPMGEVADARSAAGLKNIWGTVPHVIEMQSEAGAAGAVHGALATGSLSTTFTASQGLLLMIPSMYKIAGELMPTVFHVSARSIATHALSIFNDHSDVMACRQTGFAMLASASVQEAMDFALIAQAATLESRVPFLHFLDGFRTTHEVAKAEEIPYDVMRAMIDDQFVLEHRRRALTPDRPTIKGTAQNPDVFFQGREAANRYYDAVPAIVRKQMDRFAELTGRHYGLYEYVGAPDAERVLVSMASSCETVHETVEHLVSRGERVGLVKVRLYRPFDAEAFVGALPKTVRRIAVLDRTKEPGSAGEPLYVDVRAAIGEVMDSGKTSLETRLLVIGGRYGLGSKDFNPAQVKAVFDELAKEHPKNHFTVGINDDVTHTSLEVDEAFHLDDGGVSALFYGLGSDGTVGANKNTIKIIGEATDNYAQGYFVYDSRKAGAVTVSHVRFGPKPIRKPYLIDRADFVACHNFSFLDKYDMLSNVADGGTFLLNSPYPADDCWDNLPAGVQRQILDKKLRFYVVDGVGLAHQVGLGHRINTVMQTAFFAISDVIPEEEAVKLIKDAIEKTYGKRGETIVRLNNAAVDEARRRVFEVEYPRAVTSRTGRRLAVPDDAPDFVKEVTAVMLSGDGDSLPVSKMPVDGTFPTGTTRYEKRNIAVQIPEWDAETCIQCGLCSLVCPHAAIRMKAYDPEVLQDAPPTFKSTEARTARFKGKTYTLQVAPEDCTGCTLCVYVCPVSRRDAAGNRTDRKALYMVNQIGVREQEARNYDFFLSIPETDPSLYDPETVKGSQFIRPLFEYSSACAGCGETPYVKLLSQLFGDRAIIANATGCSSIYGGNLPATPYTTRADGRGPAWANSLFEDNAEFGLGFRLTINKFNEFARELVNAAADQGVVDRALAERVLTQDQTTQAGVEAQRANVADLKRALDAHKDGDRAIAQLLSVADYLVRKEVWILGGDGWAYDIGFGGLDHVLASANDVNVLVLDTEVYSNTGGQMSKATPRGAITEFAASGKPMAKKNLGLMAMTYGNVYVAQVALGANPAQVVKAFAEAASYHGPSLIIAYAHCIAHGIDMGLGLEEQKRAVASGHWPLYRFDPRLAEQGKNPLTLDAKEATISFEEYAYGENRYRALKSRKPERAAELMKLAQADVERTQRILRAIAGAKPEDDH